MKMQENDAGEEVCGLLIEATEFMEANCATDGDMLHVRCHTATIYMMILVFIH